MPLNIGKLKNDLMKNYWENLKILFIKIVKKCVWLKK